MHETSEYSIEIEDKELLTKLQESAVFNFKFKYNQKRFMLNGLLLVIFTLLLGAGVGALIDLVYLKTNITNEYAILSIGSSIGAVCGLILGGILLIALKSRFVDDYGSGYGLGIGTNIFIGAIIGLFLGAAIGSLFGLIMKALESTTETTLSYPVFGVLIWITLGLNIGALIGLLASFGIMQIVFGGLISGVVISAIGMFIIFGSDMLVLYGTIAGLISGGIISLLVKYSIDASIGRKTFFQIRSFQPKESATLVTQTQAQNCCSGYDCGSCYMSNCTCSNCGSCLDCTAYGGEVCALFSVFAIVLIPIILLIAFLTWASRRASVRLGGVMRRGALTAIGSSFSIFLIIGSNVGLTESYYNMLAWQNIIMGLSVGLFFSLFVFIALLLSIRMSAIIITPEKITWKDRHTFGTVRFENIEDFSFEKELKSSESSNSLDDYFILTNVFGETGRIAISCWETPENTHSSNYLESILSYYLFQARKRKEAQMDMGASTLKSEQKEKMKEEDESTLN